MVFKMINKKTIKRLALLVLSFLVITNLYFIETSYVSARDYGLDTAAGKVDAYNDSKAAIATSGASSYLTTRIGSIIGTVLSFVGAIFLLIIVFAGISWLMAGGNEEKIKKAGKLLTNSIIGLLIVLAAYTITAFLGGIVSP